MTGELELDVVLQRLVDEVAGSSQADAADCYLLDRERGVFAAPPCTASPASWSASSSLPTAASPGRRSREGRPALDDDYEQLAEAVPHAAYEGFRSAIVAPMRWADEVRGVLGVGTREPRPASTPRRRASCWRPSPTSRRSRCATPRASRSARARPGSSAASTGSPSVLGQPLSLAATLDALAQAAAEALGGAARPRC